MKTRFPLPVGEGQGEGFGEARSTRPPYFLSGLWSTQRKKGDALSKDPPCQVERSTNSHKTFFRFHFVRFRGSFLLKGKTTRTKKEYSLSYRRYTLTPALSHRERENSKRRNTSRTRGDAAAGVTVESRVHACIRSSDRSCVARTHHP